MMMKLYWKMRNHFMSDDGIGVIEMILILVILVAIIIYFRQQLSDIVKNVFTNINKNAKTIQEAIK